MSIEASTIHVPSQRAPSSTMRLREKITQSKANMVDWVAILEWSGSLCGLMGAFLLASHTRLSRYGWVAFLVANIAMVGFAMGIGRYGLLVQQLGFMATSLLGIYRAGFTLPFLGSRD
jgi:hypothetical protein